MPRVLLAGESWTIHEIHQKGFDTFTSTSFDTGADAFIAAAATQGIEVEQMYGHDVPAKFPRTAEALSAYDVVIISDIGANSFLLTPETWKRGERSDNSLRALVEWTEQGGGLMMAGGYLSFQGINAAANFARSPIAEVLPVGMLLCDDRVEAPEGAPVAVADAGHPLAPLLSGAPELLGYNEVSAREDARVVATVGDHPLLATREVGSGRTLAWTSDIGPHWCPQPFLDWDGFAPLVGGMLRWLADEAA
ncbi:glutamine amidotransferase [Leucobacter allii]|uniref:Glutamine amidotransferase n=1 Tax=Leucobacter allii TaxID=2932247 RepID=A0ABY4FHG3_9MICO|nr:glutamine amidotransferase [Leucobacter allii]UOQ56110.1 glutamine amidotransferase [Leucobacter allii]UOR00580.1 glutamine amidotransferase [Leucobacter allii]